MTKHIKKFGNLSRREVLVGSAAGAGLVIGYSVLPHAVDSASKAIAAGNWDHQQYLTMDTDGKAYVYVTKCEIGQHIGTALAQAVAEELEINWDDVNVIYPDSHAKWGLMITGGSWSVNWTFDRNSRIGASARIALTEAGAKLMNVDAKNCVAKNSTIHSNDGKSITYKEILSQTTIDRTFSEDEMKAIKLKSFGEYNVVGKSKLPFDLPAKLDGSAKYGSDVFVPDMVYAIPVLNPVRWGAIPNSVDETDAKKIDGYVGAYVEKNGFAKINTGYVVALGETIWAAMNAAKALKIDWDLGENKNISSKDIRDESIRLQKDPDSGFLWVLEGDTDKAIKNAQTKHTAVYETAIAYHGCHEPMNCVAYEKEGVWHLHGGNQWFSMAAPSVAAAIGVEADKVVCHQYLAGTGFGRRTEPDNFILAAQTSKFLGGRPVKLMFTREQDMMFDFHRTPTYQVIEGGVEFGKLMSMTHDVVAGWSTKRAAPGFMPDSVDKKGKVDQFSTNGSDHWYDIPNHKVRSINNELSDKALPVGFLRAVAPSWTFWAVESFMDEMAKKAGEDPLAFRIKHLTAMGKNAGSPPNTVGGAHRLRNALLVAAGRAGYGVKPMGKNEGMGIACVSSQERGSPTWTAAVAEVKVDPSSGELTVKKVTIAMDVGTAVNPEGIKKQLEGSSLHGISLALYEDMTMKNGSIEQSNYDTWTPMRLNQAPELETVIIENGHYPAGTGEPATTVVAPAIANAIENAVGARVRSIPITPEKIKSALREA
ncbi:MAG: aldehyde dehydrogenase [Rickettsiales bacterium]|nr:aldehyde dehydrogenase [Rickettsiales bacterium]